VRLLPNLGRSEVTQSKHRNLRNIFKIHLQNYSVNKKEDDDIYRYFDLTSGIGLNPATKKEGSALIFLQEASKLSNLKVNCNFFEKLPEHYILLKSNVTSLFGKMKNINYTFINKDITDISSYKRYFDKQNLSRDNKGLLFLDPNGHTVGSGISVFDFLENLSKREEFKEIDFLLNFNVSSFKRSRGCGLPGFAKYKKSMNDLIEQINKKCCLIRKPTTCGSTAFMMLFFTNSEAHSCILSDLKFKNSKWFKSLKFFKPTSKVGMEIIANIDKNFNNELKNKSKKLIKEEAKKGAKRVKEKPVKKLLKLDRELLEKIKALARSRKKSVNKYIVDIIKEDIKLEEMMELWN